MAQKTVVLLEDDLDGGSADETVTFALDGVRYEIDLAAANAARLRELFAPYVGAGRRVGRENVPLRQPARRGPRRGGPVRSDPAQLAGIRAWARARGIQVSDRGRIPAHIVEQYNNPTVEPPTSAATPGPASPPRAVTFSVPQPPPGPITRRPRHR